MWYQLSGPDNRIIPPKYVQDFKILAHFLNKYTTSFVVIDFDLSLGGLVTRKSNTNKFIVHEGDTGGIFISCDWGVFDIGSVIELLDPELCGFKTILCLSPDAQDNCKYIHRMFLFQLPARMQNTYQTFTSGMF